MMQPSVRDLTQKARNLWARAFLEDARDMPDLTEEDFALAIRLRDLGHTTAYAAARVRGQYLARGARRAHEAV